MKRIMVIGATSAIAEHCMRIWARRGDSLFLWGRDSGRLDTISRDLKVRGADKAEIHVGDICDSAGHESAIEKAYASLGGVDVVLIAHGTLPDQELCEKSVKETMAAIDVNALSVVALLTVIANRFEAQDEGVIAVISSVAGERGRAGNYVYGSAKAMVTAFTSGLRQRLARSNVSVVTIKPGFVDTPMTDHIEKGLLWAKPERVATTIVRAIDTRRNEVFVPFFWRYIMAVVTHLPTRIFLRLKF